MKIQNDSREFIYQIDSKNKIIFVNKNWSSFAQENGVADSLKEVLDKPIANFISGDEVKHLYDLLFQKVRQTRSPIKLPFRCDSPDCRRFMEMTITSDSEGTLLFKNRILKIEFRKPIALLDPSTQKSDQFLRICSWCKKIAQPNSDWVEVEEMIEQLKLFNTLMMPKLTHGMCPSCKQDILKARQKMKK